MKTNIFKRVASLLLAMLMCLSTLIGVGLTAAADEVPEQDKTVVFSFPRDGDENYTAEWGHDDLSFMNGWFRHSAKRTHIFSIGSWNGNVCYCLEPGTPIANDQILTRNDESFFEDFPSELNNTISADNIRLFLGRIMQYGYCGTVSTSWRSQNEEDADKMAHAVATQIIIWETIVGERDEYFNHVDTGNYDAILDIISTNHPLYDRIMSYYNSMVRSVQTHTKVPSFCKKSTLSAQVATLSWNGTKYTATLTDTNNVLGNYTFTTNNSKVTCSVSGNKLTISSSTAINSEVTITANKVNSKRKGVVVWGDGVFDTAAGDIQDLVTYSAEVDDPVVGYVKIKSSSGSAKIVKTSEDGKVSGVKFTVVGNGINTTVTTNANGEITVPNLTAGTYTVTELTDDIYNPQQSKTVTVVSGQIATVTFHNTLKFGYLRVYKSAEDNIEGIKFHLYGTSDSGIEVDEYAITDSNGVANFKNVPIGSNFTLEEIDTEEQHIVPDKQTVSIEWDRVTEAEFENILKRGELKVIKTAEDKIIEGVEFRLYGTSISGEQVDEVAVTDSSGVAHFKNILIGYNYTLEELNTDNKYVTPVSQSATIEWNKVTEQNFYNELKRGSLTVTKTAEDGLVKDITFRLYGISDSGETVDIQATTDSYGKAYFTDVLLGSDYTLEEVDTENKYITPIKQHVEIEWNKVTEKDFYNQLKRGDLTVIKNSEDGLVEGITFRLYGKAECGQYVDVYATTDKSGKAYFKDILIGSAYTVEECNVSEKYITPIAQTNVVIEWEKVTQTTFENVLKRGDLKVTKTAEDGLVEGLTFHLYGYSLSGIYVDEYTVTNGNGIAEFKDILIGTNYTLEESNCPDRYVVPELQGAAIEWNKVTNKSFDNILKKWNAEVYKVDSEYDNPQGDATLEGAVYGVYKGDVLIDRYTTDENGYFITEFYPCGDDWTISEISPSEGYLLDETVYDVGAEANKYTIELNTKQFTVKETVVKGSISIIKHCDDGSTQLETPEVGAEFQVFLSSALSYENAKETERDILVCDEHGYAQTKDLPYGIYTVKQTKGWDGRDLMPEFTVVIDENGKVYRYLINNSVFESFVQIIKVDAETGNTIPYAGAGFKIYDPNGKLVTMTLTYPEVVTVDTFYTSENGYLITPESLKYGVGYYLIEEQAPYGYVLDKTPVYFDITEDNSTTENAVTVVKVTKENTAQKGIIKITKSGEVFSAVIEKEGMYQPIYSVSGLAGAVYEITAAEDVITLDGTVRYAKGEVVATLTTDENGYAESKPLYLGKFVVREVKAPYGMVLNTEPVTVELTYAGQEVEITDTSASFVNDRQRISIDFIKSMEKDELFGIGNNNEVLSVQFALYAARDIVASDGTMIPKGGLIEISSCNVDGKLTFNTDMPVDSVVIIKEYSTDEHYILYEGEFLVVFDYAGQDEKIVHVTLNDCADITNEIIRGTVIGKKVDEDGFSIAGALFGLFKLDETIFTEETALMVSESNEIGVFGFENVPYGNWIIRELKPAPAFVLNEEIYEVNITEDEQIIEITVVNRFIIGSVRVWKVDEEVPDSKLSNAVFAVYCDVDGNGEFNAEIDMLVGELTELEAGLYGMDNLRYNGYFLHEEIAPDGFIKDDNYYYFEIRNDGEVVLVENKVGVGFTNTPQKGNLKIVKTSNDGKVEGFSFRVTNEEYGYDEVFTTDVNGEIFIEELRIGKYTVSEVVEDISINYIRPEDVIATVETNDTATVTMNNVLIDIPKTGDDRNIHIWYALAGVSIIGIIGMTVYLFRRKKRGGF